MAHARVLFLIIRRAKCPSKLTPNWFWCRLYFIYSSSGHVSVVKNTNGPWLSPGTNTASTTGICNEPQGDNYAQEPGRYFHSCIFGSYNGSNASPIPFAFNLTKGYHKIQKPSIIQPHWATNHPGALHKSTSEVKLVEVWRSFGFRILAQYCNIIFISYTVMGTSCFCYNKAQFWMSMKIFNSHLTQAMTSF